ncbi:polymorphic toxin-type HINT domain-containing protein [Streptomyces sp. B8F3]|uniref:polymorphic toxin-type HINT domain-containing protein n=1 Tax=Streptomyces sp. B8F3 TaxID=3153573 RepID=UPI00325E8D84
MPGLPAHGLVKDGPGAVEVRQASKPVKLVKAAKACKVPHSFVPGTEVLLADGSSKPIEDLEIGDKVVVTDPETGKTSIRKIVATITTEDDKDFVDLVIKADGETTTLTSTTTHPFWTREKNDWVDAGDLTPGQTLRTPDGTIATVQDVRYYTKRQRTHDLTINEIHTYYVLASDTPVLVHNCNIESARFAQKSYSENFSKGGLFKGRRIDDVAGDLRSGVMSPNDVPIKVVIRDGNMLITNTRSAQALIRAGIPRSSWNVLDKTGDPLFEKLLSGQLRRNGLTSEGIDLP